MNINNNKVAFITGGSKGIGLGIASILAGEGIKVAITSRSLQNAEQAAARINQMHPDSTLALQSDVRNFQSQRDAVEKVLAKWGRLDYVIANAGVGHFAPIDELSSELWQETIDINLTGVFYTAKATIAHLKQSRGYFITIGSLAGTNFFAGGTAYNASKFGITGFSQAMMLDVRKQGIKVSTIMPGSVATGFNSHIVNDTDGWKIQPEDIGRIVSDLIKMPARTLPSKIEVRPLIPG